MADEPKARPVSGEIMTGAADDAAAPRGQRTPGDDIVDAEFEVISAAAPLVAAPEPKASAAMLPAMPPLAGMQMLRRPHGQPERVPAARGGPIFWIFGVGLAAAAFWVSGGHALVRSSPLLSQQQLLAPALRISGFTSRVDVSGVHPVLFVDGEAANDGSASAPLPPLDIAVTGNDGLITRYRLGTSGRALAPSEKFAFSSRLDVPKNGVKTVTVTFGE